MRGVSSRDFKNTGPDAIFCGSRNTVQHGVFVIERRPQCEGEHKVRPYENCVRLEHVGEHVSAMLENLSLERTI
jgi:hypothetical protein